MSSRSASSVTSHSESPAANGADEAPPSSRQSIEALFTDAPEAPPAHSPFAQASDGSAEDEEMQDMDEKVENVGKERPRTFGGVYISKPEGFRKEEYKTVPGENRIVKVLDEEIDEDGLSYTVRFGDTRIETVNFARLLELDNGEEALDNHQNGLNSPEGEPDSDASDAYGRKTKSRRKSLRQSVTSSESGSEMIMRGLRTGKAQLRSSRGRPARGQTRSMGGRKQEHYELGGDDDDEDSDDDDGSEEEEARRRGRRSGRLQSAQKSKQCRLRFERLPARANHRPGRGLRQSAMQLQEEDDEDSDDNEEDSDEDGYSTLRSDVRPHTRKRRKLNHRAPLKPVRPVKEATRRSDRSNRTRNNMEEVGIEDDYVYDDHTDGRPAPAVLKVSGARETFQPIPRGNRFRERHMQVCHTCGNQGGQLIFCQGCTFTYHRACLGPRGSRDHLVTKVGEEDFVLQCRRCVNTAQKKDPYAPDMARCQDCHMKGASCVPFRTRKTSAQEQKEREENDDEDPIYNIAPSLINNHKNVLFRCVSCSRPAHLHHLAPRNPYAMAFDDEDELADARFVEYSKDWKCKECTEMPGKVGGIFAWRPVDVESYTSHLDLSTIGEDEKEYLIKWQEFSYFRAQWMPGAWVWGVVAPASRLSFSKKFPPPKMRTEDAIPEEWLRIDIVLDVKYTNTINFKGLEVDKARIKEVDQALIKYKGLGYEDAVWEKVPAPEDGDRWTDFVTAYNDWVLGRYTTLPSSSHLKARIDRLREKPFKEKAEQPSNLEGGNLMKYQLEGLNWLYYQWYLGKNGILADEMGLGKTIQIIAFLATLTQDIKCYPFLVVVPNSTCPNWRREIKQWAPSLRVVTYYGSAMAREMAYKYELFPDGNKALRCHVVVTSYDAVVDESSKKLFRSVQWQGLIVDEGQRLKNDQSQLHNALKNLKIPFRMLLTGTPLQNNARELFNLLQFLDDKVDAEAMEKEYENMTNDKIAQLHNLIRPFILRRTKLQVLGFLPPMGQIIVPVSMSHLQKKTYKSILEQKPDLLRALLSEGSMKSAEKVGLNNILMQLRKCLCHPFVFNKAIEERHLEQTVTHKNLVEASSKLQLLEIMLPKLQERGHRVLIFSQFLDMLDIIEDFLDGMGLLYNRLDGSISSLEKQKRIDEFNAPGSPLFAFLLSTRAGGVGINLATADTVIILDPDFNPHQDIQAISRAHRIGQTKKVLCFQLMTRASAEEKIMQVGRKKMALDEVVINQLDDEEIEDKDMEGILKHGMAELFEDDDAEQIIRYDESSVEKLLDRSQIENTKSGEDNTAESQFSFARIWANDAAVLQNSLDISEEERAPDKSLWEKILQDRERRAAERAAMVQLGRGKRNRQMVDYNQIGSPPPDAGETGEAGEAVKATEDLVVAEVVKNIASEKKERKRKARKGDDSDTDFMLDESEESADDETEMSAAELADANGPATQLSRSQVKYAMKTTSDATREVLAAANPVLVGTNPNPNYAGTLPRPAKKKPAGPIPTFRRAIVPPIPVPPPVDPKDPNAIPRLPDGRPYPPSRPCPACRLPHPSGSCPLKVAGVEHCNLCGLAHYGHSGRVCPHFRSETMVRVMLDALRSSQEPKYLVTAAMKYMRGLKGSIVQNKKLAKEKGMIGETQGQPGSSTSYAASSALGPGVVVGPIGTGSLQPPRQQNGAHPHANGQAGPQQGTSDWASLPVEERLMALTG